MRRQNQYYFTFLWYFPIKEPLGTAFCTYLSFCSLLFSTEIPWSDLPPHCSLKYTRKETAHWYTAYSWNVPTSSKIRDNPCLHRMTKDLEQTHIKTHNPLLLHFHPTVTALQPQSSVGLEDRQGWWSSFPLTQRAQVLQQKFSFCSASITLLAETPPQSMIVCWPYSSGLVILAHIEQ